MGTHAIANASPLYVSARRCPRPPASLLHAQIVAQRGLGGRRACRVPLPKPRYATAAATAAACSTVDAARIMIASTDEHRKSGALDRPRQQQRAYSSVAQHQTVAYEAHACNRANPVAPEHEPTGGPIEKISTRARSPAAPCKPSVLRTAPATPARV